MLADRLRWASAAVGGQINSLPPFWMAFAFVVAVSLPQAFLALPIVVADVGPLAGLALIGVLGIINVLTMACTAEAITRSGTVRYGDAFVGRLVADYLGAAGSYVLTLAVSLLFFLALIASYVGLATTLSDFAGLPAALWIALPFLVGVYLLSRASFAVTASVSIGLGAINIVLIVLISLLALGHFQPANLLADNGFFDERSLELSVWRPVLGVMLIMYFGHVPLNQCARTVLHRDPSGRGLLLGSVAGTVCLTVLIGMWLVAVNGAVAPQQLAGQTGTALVPLAAVLGPGARVLESALVVLLLGLTSLRCSTILFNLVRERLPKRSHPLVLPRERGKLLFHPRGSRRGNLRLTLTYLGLDGGGPVGEPGGEPRFRLDTLVGDRTLREEIGVTRSWTATESADIAPYLQERGLQLTFDVLDANEHYARLRVTSPMAVTYEGDWDVETATELVQHQPETDARSDGRRAAPGALKERGRFWICVGPVALAFLVAEWQLLTGTGSFARLLSVGGVLAVSLIAGIFPVLLLAASRRKGELVPGVVYRFLGHPVLIASIYVLFLANILLHGLVIWQAPVERVAAVLTGVVVAGATLVMVRRGALARRVVVELREDQRADGRAVFTVVASGQPVAADVQLTYPDGEHHVHAAAGEVPRFTALRDVLFRLPDTHAQSLKVWVHRIAPSGDSEALPAVLHVRWDDTTQRFDLQSSSGLLLPLDCKVKGLSLHLPERSAATRA
ncbi:MAG: hypothetical protein H0V83_02510 [Rubrobacter sp.]|nr:hypothetical protein [Rubrobacter sp.]